MLTMAKRPLAALTALALAGLLGGCGSSTDTVSVAESSPPATDSTAASTAASTTTSTAATTPTSSKPTSTAGGAAAPSTSHTAPEPAFTQQEAPAEGTGAAATLVRAHGYTPNETSQYHPDQTLRVLVGTRSGSSDGYGQQAFFFIGGHYIGTDTKEPSATIKVLSQSDTEVTLAYPLYRNSDPLSSPSGGQAVVHFQLNNGKLTPLGTIPPANSSTGLARN